MTNQTPDAKVTRNYDAGIIALVAILLVVVIGGGIYLVSIAVGAAPIVSTIFGMMFAILTTVYIVSLMVQNRWAIQKISDTSMSTADAFAKALMSYKSQKNEAAPTFYAPRPAPQIADIRRTFNGGLPPGVSGARVSDGATEYEATTAALTAALDLLSEGKDPTRSNFKGKGIMSSTEASGAVNLLASLGYIDPIVQGAPAEWAASVVPSDVASIADHLRRDIPALPVYEPVFAEIAPQAGLAGNKAGRGRGRK